MSADSRAEANRLPSVDCRGNELGELTDALQLRDSLSDADCTDPFDVTDHADILRFRIGAPATVQLSMQALQFHAQLRLVSSQGNLIADARSGAVGASAQLELWLSPGWYEIVATENSIGRATGDYLLQLDSAPRTTGGEPRFVYPRSEPSYAEPPDWIGFGRFANTKCSVEPSELLKRDAVSALLFNHSSTLWARLLLPPEAINHSYNCHGAWPQIGWTGYEGGHSGWDVQSYNVIGDLTSDDVFYSLTDGTVAYVGGGYGAIVIHTDDGHTIWYQHARKFYVMPGREVSVGDALGVQGNVGMGLKDENGREHVHVAVRPGRHLMPPPRGAIETIDPVPYLYNYLFE